MQGEIGDSQVDNKSKIQQPETSLEKKQLTDTIRDHMINVACLMEPQNRLHLKNKWSNLSIGELLKIELL
jgi:hypothetical protein